MLKVRKYHRHSLISTFNSRLSRTFSNGIIKKEMLEKSSTYQVVGESQSSEPLEIDLAKVTHLNDLTLQQKR